MAGQTQARRRELALGAIAGSQHGVIARHQLLSIGFKSGAIERRLESGRLHRVHRGVYAVGRRSLDPNGRWMAAVIAGGDGAVLSHRSAACLWGLRKESRTVDVTSTHGRRGPAGVAFHRCQLEPEEVTERRQIPVTTADRTLFDLAEVVDIRQLRSACEEADRLGLLRLAELERVIERGWGRHALKPIRQIVVAHRYPDTTKSPLEDLFLEFCSANGIERPTTNVLVCGYEVDAFWPGTRLTAELDSWEFHGHRGAFERDRARDATLMVAGYRIIRVTHRRIRKEPSKLADEIRHLLAR
jgi:hypothetical protein